MKIVIAGDWHSDLHEEELYKAFCRLGIETNIFKWYPYLSTERNGRSLSQNLAQRFQNRYIIGPALEAINRDFLEFCSSQKADVVFVYRGTHIWNTSLAQLHRMRPRPMLVGYNNDNPFSPDQSRFYWRHFISSIPTYDLVLSYRQENIAQYQQAGAKRVEMLRSWYVKERNYPVLLTAQEKNTYECDVVFVGHYENDQRVEYLETIMKTGISLRLFGPAKDWKIPQRKSKWLSRLPAIQPAWGPEYNKALCGAKIALCFLSKLNRDTYTRRCFEIPATGTFLLSEYSEDLATMFIEGEQIEFFRNKEEMMDKIAFYLSNTTKRKAVAMNGMKAVADGKHDVDARVMELLIHLQSGLYDEN